MDKVTATVSDTILNARLRFMPNKCLQRQGRYFLFTN